MANKYLKQFMYSPHVYPVLLDFNFVVDSANGNGLGIRSLKGNGISAVYMHTSATPAATNPNPAAGEIIVQLSDNYTGFLGSWGGFVSPLNGSSSTSSTANVINVIVSLGTATVAQWQAVGLPLGIAPAVGVGFVATSSALIGGSAAVQLRATAGSGIDHIEVVGDPNAGLVNSLIQNPAIQQANGGYVYMACFKNTVLTAPADNSVIGLQFYLNNHKGSSVLTG
jgi:hypothetical protein